MILTPLKFTNKTNQTIELRSPHLSEAQNILDTMAEIAKTSPYILSTPETFKSRTEESQIKWIEDSLKSDSSIIIGVYHNKKLIGLCGGHSYKDIKRKHRASLGVSIHPDYRGMGLGKKLMDVLITEMKKFKDIKMIELDVMTINTPAVKLYESLGFKTAGRLPGAFRLLDGTVTDNLHMYLDV